MKRRVDKLEKIREIEYDLDRIRSLVERVDERANGVMYASGALAIFYVTLLTLITKLDIDLELLVDNHLFFVVFLFFSSLWSIFAFVLSIVSIYPIPFNFAPPKVDKEGVGTSSKDGTKREIIFEPIFKLKLKMIKNPNLVKSAESCQNMNINKILYDKCAVLHGQKLAVVRKYNWLRWALIFLGLSVVFLFISPLSLVF